MCPCTGVCVCLYFHVYPLYVYIRGCVCVCMRVFTNIALGSETQIGFNYDPFTGLHAVSCPPGKENKPGSNVCTECPQGFYKNNEAAALCHPCPTGFVTRINGSTSRYDCQLSQYLAHKFQWDVTVSRVNVILLTVRLAQL